MLFKTAVKVVILLVVCGSVFGQNALTLGIAQHEKYAPLLKGKKVAVCGNQSSVLGDKHLVDLLIELKIEVTKIYSPEHGFRGNHSAGAHINSSIDKKTGLPIVSLYGSHKEPTAEDLQDVDIVVFDIQDVGARFYTYISTLHYVMDACMKNGKEVLVLDRPNPNGHYVDGPILEPDQRSFVGMHQVPIVHGMTIGEYAKMINGEGWLSNGGKCPLTVIPMLNYHHKVKYSPPINPSPNLPSRQSILLYPSLCLFEGTVVSLGRGTEWPFEIYGTTYPNFGSFAFTPKSIPGVADKPKHEGKQCTGQNLRRFTDGELGVSQLHLVWLLEMYKICPNKETFFLKSFNRLAGTSQLKEQIIAGLSEEEIKESWKPGLSRFKQIRKKYLLYP